VCNPQYRDQHPGLDTSADVLKHNLIHADIDNHNLGDEWCAWLQGSGMTCPAKFEGLSFHDPALAMQAAADGLGLAIGYLELIGRDLQMGKLVTASGSSVKHQLSYHLVYNRSSVNTHQVRQFPDWLIGQVKQ
jgi:LysR family glycine cleavage system transcriptional activator